jgi:hypothetical protein
MYIVIWRTLRITSLLLPLLSQVTYGVGQNGEREVKTITRDAFKALTVEQMQGGTIYYSDNSDNVTAFADWATQSTREEKELLGLYPGFVEPTVPIVINGVKKSRVETMTMFISRARFVLDKPAQKINLADLISLEQIKKFDREMQHREIQPTQLMSVAVASQPVANFQWCNTSKESPEIARPQRETDLSHIDPKGQWCRGGGRFLCLESCYLFDTTRSIYVKGINTIVSSPDEKKDYGMAMQSETRAFNSEQELNPTYSVKKLTGIETPVLGGLVQNIFYFNQIMQYGKVLMVLQSHPKDAQKSVITAFLVTGIKTRTFMKNQRMVGDVILGKYPRINSSTGLTAGLPKFTQNKIKAIASVLEE